MKEFTMTVVTKVFNDGKVKHKTKERKFTLPEQPSEMTMRHWTDLHIIREGAPKWFKEIDRLDENGIREKLIEFTKEQWIEFLVTVARMVSACSKEDLTDVVNTNVASSDTLYKYGDGIIAMYVMLWRSIVAYNPREKFFDKEGKSLIENYSFKHKGKTYVIPEDIVQHVSATNEEYRMVGGTMNTITAIEALQVEHVLNAKDSETGEYVLEDRKYHTDIALVATLARIIKPNGELEQIPLDFVERRRWLDRRIKTFSSLGMDIALDIDFFLQSLKSASLSTLISSMSLQTSQVVLSKLNK